ncbi:hypothetical protein GA0115233_100395 [Streptomyces sp. DI166]|nr:hypothetical protein GA0115233_100395 [Streptomyces sp. DI166]
MSDLSADYATLNKESFEKLDHELAEASRSKDKGKGGGK